MKKKKSTYERFMLACINSLPFTFHSPGKPNLRRLEAGPGHPDKKYPEGRIKAGPTPKSYREVPGHTYPGEFSPGKPAKVKDLMN